MMTENAPQQATAFAFPSAADLQMLSRAEGPCVTVCLSPHVAGTGSRPSGIALKALLPEVRRALQDCGVHPQDAESLLGPLEAMTADASLQGSHEHCLCLFRSPREFHCFSIRGVMETGWHVDERFFVQPILAHLDYRNTFLLLALAAKHVRLLRCEGGTISTVPFPAGVPESEAEFTGDTHGGEHTKNHAAGVKFTSSEGKEKSVHFPGDFMKAIDRGLQPIYRELGLPLVLAGVDEETAAYLSVSDYALLVPEGVKLSPDGGVTGPELALAGAQILKRWSSPTEKQALTDFAAMGTGRRSSDSTEILPAAAAGKVQHLLVQRGGRIVGHAQRILGLGVGEGYVYKNADLVNATTVEVLKHKGHVWLLEPEQMPEAVAMVAVMRYADDKVGA